MGYQVRTLAQLATAARQYFVSAVEGAIASIWPNTFTVTGKVLALLDFENELRRQWLYQQMFASTAQAPWLYRIGWELGLTPDPAEPATGTATVAATVGLAIPQGTQFSRGDGATFSTRAAVTPTSVAPVLALQADLAGAAGVTAAGTALTLVPSTGNPAGLGTTATVIAQSDGGGLEGGADAETLEHFRQRVLQRKQAPPQGGNDTDYVAWAQAALATVTAVYVDSFTNNTRCVWVSFTVSDQPNGIPTAGQVATVQAYLSDPVRRPRCARVYVSAPAPQIVPIEITNLQPDTADAQAAVVAELAAVFAEQARPATPSTPFVLYQIWLEAAIERAAGVVAATQVQPAGDITYSTAGQMPVIGTPTFG